MRTAMSEIVTKELDLAKNVLLAHTSDAASCLATAFDGKAFEQCDKARR